LGPNIPTTDLLEIISCRDRTKSKETSCQSTHSHTFFGF
jgi:hypothetical protein